MAQTQLVIITCLIGVAIGASLFGIDVASPSVIKTGLGEMLQAQRPNMPRRPQSPLGWNNPFSSGGKDTFNSASSGSDEEFKFPQELTNINKRKEGNQISKTQTPSKKMPYNIDEVPDNSDQNTGTSGFELDTLGWSYTTEPSEFETTTDDALNRIGAAPPAVVASLLG